MNRTYNFEKVFEQVRQNIDLPEGSVYRDITTFDNKKKMIP